MSTRSEGYTIIEVSLFLAVSGLLVLIALFGTGTAIRSTRFTDSARSLHAYLQKQYDNILNGVNSRTGNEACVAGNVVTGSNQQAGTSNCLLLGKLVTLKQGSSAIKTYDIVGTEPPVPNYNAPDAELIADFTPTVVRNVGTETYDIPWGTQVSGTKRLSDNQAVDTFALIRSPRSARIVSYTFESPSDSISALAPIINPRLAANTNNINKPTNFCLISADNIGIVAKIGITDAQGQDALLLDFNAQPGDCDGS